MRITHEFTENMGGLGCSPDGGSTKSYCLSIYHLSEGGGSGLENFLREGGDILRGPEKKKKEGKRDD